jgi:hypothetical protein
MVIAAAEMNPVRVGTEMKSRMNPSFKKPRSIP